VGVGCEVANPRQSRTRRSGCRPGGLPHLLSVPVKPLFASGTCGPLAGHLEIALHTAGMTGAVPGSPRPWRVVRLQKCTSISAALGALRTADTCRNWSRTARPPSIVISQASCGSVLRSPTWARLTAALRVHRSAGRYRPLGPCWTLTLLVPSTRTPPLPRSNAR